MINQKNKWAAITGIFACAVLYPSMLISALSYKGYHDKSYSIFNCFISDLGNYKLSSNYFVFNYGVVISSIGFGFFAFYNNGIIKTKLARTSVVIGIIASFLLAGVGLIPTTYGLPHLIVAISFFILMTLALTLYSVCIWITPNNPFPKWIAVYGFYPRFP